VGRLQNLLALNATRDHPLPRRGTDFIQAFIQARPKKLLRKTRA
jgi:hypothetical protein